MNITVVGLGYVGTVTMACLASRGHCIWGVDINPKKVECLNRGEAPFVEPGLEAALAKARQNGSLRVGADIRAALEQSSICFISVATPSQRNGHINSQHLRSACSEVASALQAMGRRQIVAIRSSILPTVLNDVERLLEEKAPGLVDLCVNPEFLREGTAILDFDNPPFTVIGTENSDVERALRSVYSDLAAPVYVLPAAEATLVKYASNAFHALKASFANEIGRLCVRMGINGDSVMEVFCKDTKLNISANYLRPGFAFGGSCLPKDVRALQYAGRISDMELPIMHAILESNAQVIEEAVQAVLDSGARRVLLAGLSFKKNTDDLRESPFVELAEQLIGKGVEVNIYDPNVALARLTGANKEYIERAIPHLSRLLVSSLETAASASEMIVIGHSYPEVETLRRQGVSCQVLDLTGQLKLTCASVKDASPVGDMMRG